MKKKGDVGFSKLRKPAKLTKNGLNTKIRVKLLSDGEMRNLGFTDHRVGYWFFCKDITPQIQKNGYTITFNVSIKKDNISDFSIDVLDSDWCQPYNYQQLLADNAEGSAREYALAVWEEVEEQMSRLQRAEVLSGHNRGDYI
jgi:hypothetical protein